MSFDPPLVLQETVRGSHAELELWIRGNGGESDEPGSDPFAGHFPQHPVLPGLAQLQWAIFLARHYIHAAGDFDQILETKFRKLIRPEHNLHLSLTFDVQLGELEFIYFCNGETYSSGRLR